jgi:hypothetical protein
MCFVQVLEVRPLINVEGTAKDSRNTQKRQQQLFKVSAAHMPCSLQFASLKSEVLV